MRTRAAMRAELDAVWEIEREVFAPDVYPRFFFRQMHDLAPDLLRVAEVEGQLAGYALGAVSPGGRAGWILSAAARPAYRRRGVARALTEDLLHALAQAGVGAVRLTVHPENRAARRLYDALGFQVEGEDPEYFGAGEPRVILARRLAPE